MDDGELGRVVDDGSRGMGQEREGESGGELLLLGRDVTVK